MGRGDNIDNERFCLRWLKKLQAFSLAAAQSFRENVSAFMGREIAFFLIGL